MDENTPYTDADVYLLIRPPSIEVAPVFPIDAEYAGAIDAFREEIVSAAHTYELPQLERMHRYRILGAEVDRLVDLARERFHGLQPFQGTITVCRLVTAPGGSQHITLMLAAFSVYLALKAEFEVQHVDQIVPDEARWIGAQEAQKHFHEHLAIAIAELEREIHGNQEH